jgi:hypothetical protein
MITNSKLEVKSNDAPIDIYFDDKKPTREYEQIAFIEKEAFWGFSGSGEVIENLKKTARKLGGDAIILKHVQESNYWHMGETKIAEAKGVVIRYTDTKK